MSNAPTDMRLMQNLQYYQNDVNLTVKLPFWNGLNNRPLTGSIATSDQTILIRLAIHTVHCLTVN